MGSLWELQEVVAVVVVVERITSENETVECVVVNPFNPQRIRSGIPSNPLIIRNESAIYSSDRDGHEIFQDSGDAWS